MNKKVLIPIIIVGLLLVAGIAYLAVSLNKQKEENRAMQELAEMDKKEMENEYQQFARQYSEMKTQINNDSIVAQLTAEQERTQQLLEELRRTKSNDAREISRLKKELATVRAVLRSYVLEIDSLNRLNQNLKDENNRMRGQYEEATRQIEGLNTEKASLSEKVAIAAQLDAIGINLTLKDKKSPSPEAESMAYLEKHPDTVIICDEVGSGIVPLDSFEREYRERLGRLLCEIAAKAERVERIVCGIGQRIK